MTTTALTELPIVQSGSSCCSTVLAPAAASLDETAPTDPQGSSCCSTQG